MRSIFRLLAAATLMLTGACTTLAQSSNLSFTVKPLLGQTADEQRQTREDIAAILAVPGLDDGQPNPGGRMSGVARSGGSAENLWGAASTFDQYARRNAVENSQGRVAQPEQKAQLQVLAYYLLDKSDRYCMEYMDGILTARQNYRTGLTVSGSVFGAAGALATPALSSKILSGLSGLASGVRGNLDETVFDNQSAEIVRNALIASRGELRTQFITTIDDSSSHLTTAASVLAAGQAYHARCSLSEALGYVAAHAHNNDTPGGGQQPPPAHTP